MAGYLGTKAVLLSTTAADVVGNAEIGGSLTVGGSFTSTGIDDNAASTAITIDGSQNVGIGTSSPTGLLTLDGNGDAYIAITHSSAMAGGMAVQNRSSGGEGVIAYNSSPGGERWEFFINSSEKMRIDSAGRVTKPYQPAFYGAYTGVNVGWASNQTFGWNVVHMNVGNHFNGATGLFTAPVTGVYSFNYSAWAESGPTQVCFKVNGADFRPAGADTQGIANITSADGQRTGGTTIVIPLAAGDYVHVGMRTGFADTIYMGHSHFSGYLIG